jgi:hypothetical protein
VQRRNPPFAVAVAVALILTIAFFRLPETLIIQIEHRAIATGPNADWIYRLLALVALLQAVYAGTILRPERVKRFLPSEEPSTREVRERLFASASRSASFAVLLTLVYGFAAFFITGGRASMWLFVAMTAFQTAWYYRQLGRLATWLELQPGPPPRPPSWAGWKPEPEDYTPPMVRGLGSSTDAEAETNVGG